MDELLWTTKEKYVCYFLSSFYHLKTNFLLIFATLVAHIYTMHCNNIYIYAMHHKVVR